MSANSCQSHALAAAAPHRSRTGSAQAAEETAVTPAGRPGNVFADVDFLRERLDNSSSESELHRSVAAGAVRKLSKPFVLSELESSSPEREGATAPVQGAKSRRVVTLVRWLKFNFVGGIGIAVQFFALFLLKSVLHFDYLLATALAVETAVVHNFVWHEQFTWADRLRGRVPVASGSFARFLRFNLTTGAVSILGNLALMKVLVGFGHMQYLVANAIAIALCSVANFLVSDGWVFGGGSSGAKAPMLF